MTLATIKILESGPYSTIQDIGRKGHQYLGVPEGGVSDLISFNIANALLKNKLNNPVLETYVGGLKFTIDKKIFISFTGSISDRLIIEKNNLKTYINPGTSKQIEPYCNVFVPQLVDSNCVIIGFSGEFLLPKVFNSLSTSVNSKIGGLNGSLLKKGDTFKIRKNPDINSEFEVKNKSFFSVPSKIRVILGPQDFWFTRKGIQNFFSEKWTITSQMDRMGIRLSGKTIEHKNNADILSDGIVKGSIQIPGNGQPIIMMSDHQTTGGYTKIATVASVDYSKLSRLRPGTKISFVSVNQSEASNLFRKQKQMLDDEIKEL